MEKLFTSGYSPFVLLGIGLAVGFYVMPEDLQKIAATVGMAGLGIGMTKQVIMQYQNGRCGIHWLFVVIMFCATVLRGTYMIRTEQYWLAIPDIYGVLLLGISLLQLVGYLIKKLPAT